MISQHAPLHPQLYDIEHYIPNALCCTVTQLFPRIPAGVAFGLAVQTVGGAVLHALRFARNPIAGSSRGEVVAYTSMQGWGGTEPVLSRSRSRKRDDDPGSSFGEVSCSEDALKLPGSSRNGRSWRRLAMGDEQWATSMACMANPQPACR